MKKSLIMILGAALLMVGCSKELETTVNDLASRLDAIEAQVAANKAAIEELQKAEFITAVEQTSEGWIITLSNGKKLALYNGQNGKDGATGQNGKDGKDGQDGDAYFQSVVIEGNTVVITLTDGTVITLPLVEEFALSLNAGDAIVEPGATVRIKFSIVGQTNATTVNAIASGNYTAEIEGNEVVIVCPEVITAGRVLVYADNGAGKTSIKSIDVDSQRIAVGAVSGGIYFWGGAATFDVASNVDVTVEVEQAAQSWLTVAQTKGVTTKTYSAKAGGTPYKDSRYGKVYVKDPAGATIETLEVCQYGTNKAMYVTANGKTEWFDKFADAIAFGETSEANDVSIWICAVLNGDYSTNDICVIPAATKKNWVLRPRAATGIDGARCIIGGVNVQANGWHNMFNIAIRPTGTEKYVGSQFNGYPYGIAVGSATTADCHVTVTNVTMIIDDAFKTAQGTILAVDNGSRAIVNYNNNKGNANGARYAQLYGGTVTMGGNTIANSYSSYAVRVGCSGTKATFSNNMVDNPTFVDLHSSLADATVTFGDGTADDNHYSSACTLVAKGTPAASVTVAPASVVGAAPAAGAGNVKLNGYGFSTITSAVNFAAEGDVIEVGAGEYNEVVRVANGKKNITIKGADRNTAIIAGGIEIAGGVTVKDLTIKSKPGVTTNELLVKVDGDAYAWGHYFLARVENGASDVTFDNVHFDATDNTDDNFKGTMSMLWISQANNVVVKNSTFDTAADASYCPNQTHVATVKFENNVFNGGGKKGWVLRAMDTDDMVVSGNEFHAGIAIDVYEDFVGKLTLGDGKNDNNVYGSEVEKALAGDKDARVAAGATFRPEDVAFNAPATAEGACFDVLWSVQMEEAGIADSRNFTFDGTNVICGCCPKPWWTPAEMVAVRGGQVVSTLAWNSEWVNGFTGAVTGLTTTKADGKTCILACNVSSLGNQWAATNAEFNVYKYTGLDKVEKVLSYTRADADLQRIGDYFSYSGTWEDGAILVCAANNTAKYAYEFPVKNGVVEQAPTLITIGDDAKALKYGTSGIFHYKDDIYVITNEGGLPLVVKRTGNELSLVKQCDVTAINGGKDLRCPKFFTLNGTEYVAALIGKYNTSKWEGTATVIVTPVVNGDIAATLDGLTKDKCLVKDIENCAAGNGFAGMDILQSGQTCYIGYGVKSGELGLIKFRNQ